MPIWSKLPSFFEVRVPLPLLPTTLGSLADEKPGVREARALVRRLRHPVVCSSAPCPLLTFPALQCREGEEVRGAGEFLPDRDRGPCVWRWYSLDVTGISGVLFLTGALLWFLWRSTLLLTPSTMAGALLP